MCEGGGLVADHLDVFEIKHISLNKSVLDVLVCPGYKQLVVVVGLGYIMTLHTLTQPVVEYLLSEAS